MQVAQAARHDVLNRFKVTGRLAENAAFGYVHADKIIETLDINIMEKDFWVKTK